MLKNNIASNPKYGDFGGFPICRFPSVPQPAQTYQVLREHAEGTYAIPSQELRFAVKHLRDATHNSEVHAALNAVLQIATRYENFYQEKK